MKTKTTSNKKLTVTQEPMTLEILASIVVMGFAKVEARFEKADERFNNLEKKLEKKIDKDIGDLATMTARGFTRVNEDIATLRYEMHERFTRVDEVLFDHEERIQKLEEK